ncbi:Pentatricopeptide repeat-containing protein [Nymphaea thermarum]|nr:Pentatricopeptide repeat-containing protein [Nymphaea thermarum]
MVYLSPASGIFSASRSPFADTNDFRFCHRVQQPKRFHSQLKAAAEPSDAANRLASSANSADQPSFHLEPESPHPSTWNAAIRASLRGQDPHHALLLYHQMLTYGFVPDKHVFTSVVKACSSMDSAFVEGVAIHAQIVVSGFGCDAFVGSALIGMYSGCGCLRAARGVFDRIAEKDTATRTAMLTGYMENGDVEGAREVFDEMPSRDVVAWNAMLSGYVQCGLASDALELFHRMMLLKVEPNYVSLVAVLSACSQMGSLAQGKWVHAFIERAKIKGSVTLTNALVHMYARCGRLDFAYNLFVNSELKNLESWNAMITGFAVHGCGTCSLSLFSQMIKLGLQPDRITFMGVLMGCSHAGMVDDGWRCLLIMRRMYKIEPRAEHYGCMIDILSRRGYIAEAHNLLVRMPFAPDISVLGALLHGCLIHGYHKMGLHIAEEIIELIPEDKGRYVTLSNLLMMLGNREAAFGVRRWMEDSEVTRSSGSSTIEIDGSIHEFIAGDRSHCRTAEVRTRESTGPILRYSEDNW